MTLRTALVISGDSQGAQRALTDLDRAIEQSEGEARAYAQAYQDADASIARLAASQTAAKREIDQAKAALKAGEISVEEYNRSLLETKTALGLVQAEHREQIATLKQTKSAYELAQVPQLQNIELTNAQRAGSQQLAMQLGDVATMYSLGARPMQIFASQGMQVVQAIGLMQGGAKGLIGFLGGPWGLGLMAATTALVPLVSSLWEAEDAMEAVELASDGMSEAQSVLEKMFDRTTGAIKEQNEQLRLNAQLLAINLRAEAESKRASADEAFDNFQRGSMGLSIGQKALGAFGIPVGGTVGREMDVRNLLREMQSGRIDRVEAAQRAQELDFDGLAISRSDFLQAIADDLSSGLLNKTADRIESSLANEELDPTFRSDRPSGRGSRSRRSGRSAEEERARLEDRYLSELASQQQEELQARLQLATNIDDELAIRMDLLGAERDERERQIQNNKDFTTAAKQAMLAHLDLLYGKREAVGSDGAIVVQEPGLLGRAELHRIAERENAMALDMLAMQADALDAQAGVALGLDERFALEKRALDLQQEIERKLLEQDIAQGRILDAAQARALLEERQAAQREGVRLDQRGPLERYTDDLNMGPEEMRRWGEQLVVDELEHLRNGMREGITDALGVDDPFLSGIIDMFIQQVLIAPFAEALQSAGAGDWVSGLFSSVLGIFGGGRAEGGPVSPGKIYAVNERSTAPGLFLPLAPGRIDPAGANDNGSMRGSSASSFNYFDLRGAVVTQDLLDQMNQIARGEAQAAVAGYDQVAASRVQDTLERRQ
jgi:hypothetical protein|tara:strand:- start:1350 stop:3689 length:2340 start_codon:yes stop_codon:yes gene_type:complete